MISRLLLHTKNGTTPAHPSQATRPPPRPCVEATPPIAVAPSTQFNLDQGDPLSCKGRAPRLEFVAKQRSKVTGCSAIGKEKVPSCAVNPKKRDDRCAAAPRRPSLHQHSLHEKNEIITAKLWWEVVRLAGKRPRDGPPCRRSRVLPLALLAS